MHAMQNLMSPEEIGCLFDRTTQAYVKNNWLALKGIPYARALDKHVQIALSRMAIPEGSSIIDAGCGVGAMSVGFAHHRPDLTITAVTISEVQADLCDNWVKSLGLQERVRVVLSDYQGIPFEGGSFDGAFFFESIGYAPLLPTFREMARVLRPGAFLFINDIAPIDRDLSISESASLFYSRNAFRYGFFSVDATIEAASECGFTTDWISRNSNDWMDLPAYWDRLRGTMVFTVDKIPADIPEPPIKAWEARFVFGSALR